MTRQGKVPSEFVVKVPQGVGTPGWLCLTRDEQSKPVSLWIPRREDAQPQILRLVWDERCYEDTIFRVEYTATHLFIADVWLWNGTRLFEKMNFADRATFLRNAIPVVYTPCQAFESRRVALRDVSASARGYEYYTDSPGEKGVYSDVAPTTVPAVVPVLLESNCYEIVATDVPDVYSVSAGGYLRVKTLALSKALRAMGRKFVLECQKNTDGTWTPVIESHSNTNGSH
jgi:hypothetical protein